MASFAPLDPAAVCLGDVGIVGVALEGDGPPHSVVPLRGGGGGGGLLVV